MVRFSAINLGSLLKFKAGRSVHYIYPGEKRPRLDVATYGPRTRRTNLSLFPFGFEWKAASLSIVATFKSLLSPIIFWCICVQGLFQAVHIAVAQTGSSLLIAKGSVTVIFNEIITH